MKLVRIGNNFSGYESTDGASWELVGTETISMPHSAYLGLAVTSHHAAQAVTATFTSVSIRAPTRSNQPPTVILTAPASGTTFVARGNVTLTAAASDADGTVSRVAFYINNQKIGADDTSSPYAITWVPAAAGNLQPDGDCDGQ